MNRKQVVEAALAVFDERIAAADRGFQHHFSEMLESEDRMKTRYDSNRQESAALAEAQQRQVAQLKAIRPELARLADKEVGGTVGLGAIVRVEQESGGERTFFLMEEKGGMEVEVDGTTIYFVSVQAPIAKAIVGKQVGDVCTVHASKPSTLTIKEVE